MENRYNCTLECNMAILYVIISYLATHSYANDTEEEDGRNETISQVGTPPNDGLNNERISNASKTVALVSELPSTIVIDARSVLTTANKTVICYRR